MPYLKNIRITNVLPCIAMPERIRIVAELDTDISEILPYLNAVLDAAIYNHEGRNITLKKGDRMVGIQARQFAAGKVIDLKDAEELIKWFKDIVNNTYAKKENIKPNYERRKKLTALDVLKLLPLTNCKKCGEATCTAFALKIAGEEKNIASCADLFDPKYKEKREILIELLRQCGYKIPSLFRKEE